MKILIAACLVAVAFASEVKNCLEEADEGMCRGYFPMYNYDPKTQTCKEFIYGGCGGNGNMYGSEEDCLKNCQDTVVWNSNSICNLPANQGNCFALFPRYYFDSESGKCTRFTYGGCGGNENNFKTMEECNQICGRQMTPEACQMEKVVGPCRAAFPRWFFNKDTEKCESFVYGGCNGNSNNFNSQEDCEGVCLEKASKQALAYNSSIAFFYLLTLVITAFKG